ncbi:hypothetical protein JCM8202v2_002226 [Rhodotorula sphaerocarpa]
MSGGNRYVDASDGRLRQISQNGVPPSPRSVQNPNGTALPVPPPPPQQGGGGSVPPPGHQMVGPSHPLHPQHASWVAHQQHMQAAAAAASGGGPGPASAPGLSGLGAGGPYAQPAGGLAQYPPSSYRPYSPIPAGLPNPAASPRNPSALPYGTNGPLQIPSPVPPSPRLPPPGPGQVHSMGSMPPGSPAQFAAPPAALPRGQVAPPPRTIPSAASVRPLSALSGSSVNPAYTSPFPQYGLPPSASQSAFASRENLSAPPPSFARPHMRTSLAPQPNTLLAAHVAVNGTGPITATSAPSGPALSRLTALNEALQLALENESPLEALRLAVSDHFTDTGVVRIGLFDSSTPMSKVFEIPCSAFPRFQHINHLLGAVSSSFHPILTREFRLTTPDPSAPRPGSPVVGGPPGGSPASFPVHIGYLLRAEDALWSSRFVDGARVDLRGNLTMHLMFKDLGNGAAGLRIESLEFDARGFEDYVTRSTLANIERALVAAAADAATAHPALKNTAPDDGVKDDSQSEDGQGGSSRRRTSRTQPGRGMSTRRRSAASKTEQDNDDDRATLHIDDDGAAPPCPPPPHSKDVKGHPLALKDHHGDLINLLRERVAPSPVGAFGVTEMGMRCLEIAESVAQLQNLIAFSVDSGAGPIESLARYADLHRSGAFAPPLTGPPHLNGHPPPPAPPANDRHVYAGPGPMQQDFAAHPGLGGDIGGSIAGPVGLKRPAPGTPGPTVLEQMDRDLPSPQKMPRPTSAAPRGRGRAAVGGRSPQHTLLAFVVTTLLFLAVSYFVLCPPTRLSRRLQRTANRWYAAVLGRVPLPPSLQTPADLVIAARSFSHYANAQQRWIGRKWLAFERMPARQRTYGDQLGWRDVLRKSEDAVELNSVVTDELAALAFAQARRDGVPIGLRSQFWRENGRVVETLKHFVRDWSADGQREREVLFPPILEALEREFANPELRKVLLPGCGLARLAYEIAEKGFDTDANDYSHFMGVASRLIFEIARVPDQYEVAPYLHSFSHHRSSANLLRTVSFPDLVPRRDVKLNFVPGDFLELFRAPNTHDAVVTLFFIDTTLFGLLKPGGIWINIGPLLYYGNPAMELPLEDVLRLVKLVGFEVLEQRELKQAPYTADDLSMYTFAYDCAFWVARKPID